MQNHTVFLVSRLLKVALLLGCSLLAVTMTMARELKAEAHYQPIAQQIGSFKFTGWQGSPLTVYFALPAPPAQLKPSTPVLFVMTGRKRNANDYRDQWKELAEQYRFIVLVPEFKWQDYPDEVSYDMGGIFRFKNRLAIPKLEEMIPVKPPYWVFSAIEPIFDYVTETLSLRAQKYSMYGHSSGAGFVHRYLYYQPAARVSQAVAANGAWYLLPRSDIQYPYGLRGSKITKQQVVAAFNKRLTIMFGQEDLGHRRQYHANTRQANLQGPHVVSRAMNFILSAAMTAKHYDSPLNWSIRSVANVGHSNTKMAPHAVQYLFPSHYLSYSRQEY